MYPKAIAFEAINSKHIVEELLKTFIHVGVPKSLLTNQGSNFTVQLMPYICELAEI